MTGTDEQLREVARRRNDLQELLCRVLREIDEASALLDALLELRAIERDPDRMT